MRSLIAPTEDFIKLARTQLSADATPGSNIVLNVYGNTNFANTNYVVIGTPGSETCEIQQINASITPGTTMTVATLIYAHRQDEQVQVFRYNQRKFYGSLTAGGTFTELTSSGSPKTIQVNDPMGTLLEYAGGEGFLYFKATYYNSTTGDETDTTASDVVLADESLRYCSIYSIRNQAGLTNNPYIGDGDIEPYRKNAENEVKSYIMSRYLLPLREVPPMLANVTKLLAAGYMDYREYGKDGEGVKWLGEARGILKAVQNGTQRLLDSNDVELPTLTVINTVQSYPNGVDNVNGPIQLFTKNQQF